MKITIVTHEYELSHMKSPRGRGSWGFCPVRHARAPDYLDHTRFSPSMTYQEAKRWAKQQPEWDGMTITVMP